MAKYIITDILVRIIHKEEDIIPIDYADDIVEMIDADLNGEIASTENVPYAVTVERISEAVKIKKKKNNMKTEVKALVKPNSVSNETLTKAEWVKISGTTVEDVEAAMQELYPDLNDDIEDMKTLAITFNEDGRIVTVNLEVNLTDAINAFNKLNSVNLDELDAADFESLEELTNAVFKDEVDKEDYDD